MELTPQNYVGDFLPTFGTGSNCKGIPTPRKSFNRKSLLITVSV